MLRIHTYFLSVLDVSSRRVNKERASPKNGVREKERAILKQERITLCSVRYASIDILPTSLHPRSLESHPFFFSFLLFYTRSNLNSFSRKPPIVCAWIVYLLVAFFSFFPFISKDDLIEAAFKFIQDLYGNLSRNVGWLKLISGRIGRKVWWYISSS